MGAADHGKPPGLPDRRPEGRGSWMVGRDNTVSPMGIFFLLLLVGAAVWWVRSIVILGRGGLGRSDLEAVDIAATASSVTPVVTATPVSPPDPPSLGDVVEGPTATPGDVVTVDPSGSGGSSGGRSAGEAVGSADAAEGADVVGLVRGWLSNGYNLAAVGCLVVAAVLQWWCVREFRRRGGEGGWWAMNRFAVSAWGDWIGEARDAVVRVGNSLPSK